MIKNTLLCMSALLWRVWYATLKACQKPISPTIKSFVVCALQQQVLKIVYINNGTSYIGASCTSQRLPPVA